MRILTGGMVLVNEANNKKVGEGRYLVRLEIRKSTSSGS